MPAIKNKMLSKYWHKDSGGFCKYAGVTSCSPPQLINTPSKHNSLGSNGDLFILSPHYLFI